MRGIFAKAVRLILHPVCLLMAAALFFALVRYLDTRWRFMPYTFSITLVIAAALFLVSRRYAFSLYAAGSVVVLIALASLVKYDLKGFALHYYDLIFTGADKSAVSFLASNYTGILIPAICILLAVIACLALIFAFDSPLRLKVRWRAAGLAAVLPLTYLTFPPAVADQPAYLPYISGYNASSFFISLADIRYPFGRIELSNHVEAAEMRAMDASVDCGTKRPDVVLVLSESQTDLANFPQINAPAETLASFRSQDGVVRPLYVETYGGGTWVTNFAVMTGLSATDFGWQSSYVTQLMVDKIKGSFPETLAKCGYRTVTVMPMEYNFVNEGPFLTSIGFQDIYDMKAIGTKAEAEDDRPYFDFARKIIAEERAKDDRPLLIAIQTMMTHGPYDKPIVPSSLVAEAKYSDDAKANEYVRRVIAARREVASFIDSLRVSPGSRGTVVMEYGDHQSEATRPFVEESLAGEPMLSDFRSIAYRTFVSIHGFGTPVDMAPFARPLDIGFLSSALAEAAQLPSSPLIRDLQSLRKTCGGRYHTCPERSLVDAHLSMRANAGMLVLR